MPYPIALAAAAAATAAGAGMQMQAQAEARDAVAKQRREELTRQQAFQRKASQAVADSLAQSGRDTAEQQIDAGTERRAGEYQKLAVAAPTAQPGMTAGDRTVTAPVATAQSNQQAAVAAWNNILGKAQARAGGYQDWGIEQNVKNRRANEKIGMESTNARNSASVNQLELQDASQEGAGLAQIGSLLGAAGSVAGMYGATAPAAKNPNPNPGVWGWDDPQNFAAVNAATA